MTQRLPDVPASLPELAAGDVTAWSRSTQTGTHPVHRPARPHPTVGHSTRTHDPHLRGILTVPATSGRALAVALNETSTTHITGRIELSRQLRHLQLLAPIRHTANQPGITFDLT